MGVVKAGDRVTCNVGTWTDDEVWETGEVVDVLSVQFTVEFPGEVTRFFFLKDEGQTWRASE